MVTISDSVKQELLAEAIDLSRRLNSGSALKPERLARYQQRLHEIQERLKTYAHPIQRESLPVEAIPKAVRDAFVSAIAKVAHYPKLGSMGWQSTLPSPTLSQYHSDADRSVPLSDQALQQLCQTFALTPEFYDQLLTDAKEIDSQITRQKQIIQTVLAQDRHIPVPQSKAAELFSHLFSGLSIPSSEIHLLHTETQLYFCINYQEGNLSNPSAALALTDLQQQQLQQFLTSLKQFSFEQFERFPVFGACDPEGVDLAWGTAIAQQLGLSQSEVLQTLQRSVSIIAAQSAESLLIHDIWGHHWQWILTSFDGDYAILSRCHEPLRPGETAYTPEGPLTYRELFIIQNDEVTINSELARLFFQYEVRQRLGVLFVHLLGEMLADVAEFKFIWDHPQSVDQLPSSSVFKANPTKLDLTLMDLDFLFVRVLQPLLELHLSVIADSELETELLTDWLKTKTVEDSLEWRTSLKHAIAQLYQIFLEEYKRAYLPTLTDSTSIFTQIAINLLYLQNAINTLYTEQDTLNHSTLPFQSLLMVFMGCYCSTDTYREFWDIDDMLAAYFLPCWRIWLSLQDPQ